MFSINLVFDDEKNIRSLNRVYRGIDKATTVLSFYYGEESSDNGQAKPVTKKLKFPKVKGDVECLGEIIICPSLAKKKNLKVEDLVIHGLKNILSEIPSSKNLRT